MRSLPAVLIVTAIIIFLSFGAAIGVTFSDVTQQAHLGSLSNSRGSAWFDYNRDGYLDLFVGSDGGSNRLYRNLGDGTFSNVTSQAHIPSALGVWGVNFADINNDGYQDLYLSTRAPDTVSIGRNILLLNTGLGYFRNISDSSGANVVGGGIASCFAPFTKSPYVDIFAPNQYYPDMQFPNLLINNGNCTFSDITDQSGLNTIDWWDVPIAFDYENDGRLELFCTMDYHGNAMYDQAYGLHFIDISDSLHFQTPCGYGATVGDVNNDGWFDLYITNWHDNTDNLFIFDSIEQRYNDRTQAWHCAATWWTSAAHFADFDNDGWLDLFISGAIDGNIYYHNENGYGYTNLTSQAGLTNTSYNWGVSVADYDNDGFLDIYSANYTNGSGKLYHNNRNTNHWLEIELEGRNLNRDAIGARLTLDTPNLHQIREVIAGSGFGTQNPLIQHFGLGSDSSLARLTVYWPGRGYDFYDSLPVDRIYHIIQGEVLSVDGNPIRLPKEFSILKTYPNPFNGQTLIEISISRPCNLTVDIVDILGRTVKSLYSKAVAQETLTLSWDGTSANGTPVSSGVYFCRAFDGHRLESSKLILLK